MIPRFLFVLGGVLLLVASVIVVVVLEKHGLDGQKKGEKQKRNMLAHDLAYIAFAGMGATILLHTHNSVALLLFGLIGLLILKETDKHLGINFMWSRNRKRFLHFSALMILGNVAAFLLHLAF